MIVEKIDKTCRDFPRKRALEILDRSRRGTVYTYAELHDAVGRAAGFLRGEGLLAGDRCVIGLPTTIDLVALYIGCLYEGVAPVMIPRPHVSNGGVDPLRFGKKIGEIAQAQAIIVPEELAEPRDRPKGKDRRVLSVEGVRRSCARSLRGVVRGGGVAHLQMTSGTTGRARLAVVRHRNLSANVEAIGSTIGKRDRDLIMSWLPLFHDMGLVCLGCAFSWGTPLVLTDADNFRRNPIRFWLEPISNRQATISPAPTSAYQLCARIYRRRPKPPLSLGEWRVAFVGAEPVSDRVLTSFSREFAGSGFRASSLRPVYGLAEATLAVTVPKRRCEPVLDTVCADGLEKEGRAVPASSSRGGRTRTIVCVGEALERHLVRVVDGGQSPVGERIVGEVRVRGSSVVDSYLEGGERLQIESPDGYLATGDLGYLADDRLYVIGRKKETIIVYGRCFDPFQVEEVVEAAVDTGIYKGVAAIGRYREDLGSEEMHVVIESRPCPPPEAFRLEDRIREAVHAELGLSIAEIHWTEKGFIEKTTSGKIKRYRCKHLLFHGETMSGSRLEKKT